MSTNKCLQEKKSASFLLVVLTLFMCLLTNKVFSQLLVQASFWRDSGGIKSEATRITTDLVK